MAAPDAVVFDLGGVLIDWDPRHLYRKVFATETETERFLSEVCTGAWNLEQDRGRPLATATAALVAAHPHERERIEMYYGRWTEMLNGQIAGTVEVVEELHGRGVPLFALTNWSAETWAMARPLYPVLDRFRGILVSGMVGMIKPDPAIYRRLCADFGLTPARAAFTDDSPKNVAGAAALGFRAHHFTSPIKLRRWLVDLGLLPEERA
ncbi:MAG: HAD family hydrolase [Alphaproteobacteria bacterium]